MPIIPFSQLEAKLDKTLEYRLFLVYGEEYLVQETLSALLKRLLPQQKDAYNYEPVDDVNETLFDVIEKMNTYPFFSSIKVVAYLNARLFDTRQGVSAFLQKSKSFLEENKTKQAANYFMRALSVMDIVPSDIRTDISEAVLTKLTLTSADKKWILPLLPLCQEQYAKGAGSDKNAQQLLTDALSKGFPEENYFILTVEKVNKQSKLYKLFNASGLVIDCSVPKGPRKADKTAQEKILWEQTQKVLTRHQKMLTPQNFNHLCDLTGFDLRIYLNNLNKIIDFIGNRSEITTADIKAVLTRSKQDPIFEFTNAITDLNAPLALFYAQSLFEGGVHPLQLLAAMTNSMRKLIVYKDFTQSAHGHKWKNGISFTQFKASMMKDIMAYDESVLRHLKSWQDLLDEKKGKTDLLIGLNPKNSYPVFATLKKTDRFSMDGLLKSLELISKTDLKLKSSPLSAKLVIEKAILKICLHGSKTKAPH